MGFRFPIGEHVGKGYDGVDASRWNLEVEPFVVRWIIQTEKNTHKLRMIEDHMSPLGVAEKERCVVNLC